MDCIVRLRLRAAGILRGEAVHQIKSDLLCDDRIAVNLGETFGAKTRALSKTTPVIDIRYCHVIDATGDAIHFAAAHYGNVDDLCHFGRNDLRKMTDVACILRVGKERHFPFVPPKVEITPNQLPNQRCGKDRLGIISVMGGGRLEVIATNVRSVTGPFHSRKRSIPNDNATTRVTGGGKPVNDRIDNIMMGSEKFAASGGDFDSNPVVRTNQGCPCLGYIGLARCGEAKPVDHLTHNARIRLVLSDCIGIAHSIYDRRRGRWLHSLPKPGGDGAKKNKSYVSHQ